METESVTESESCFVFQILAALRSVCAPHDGSVCGRQVLERSFVLNRELRFPSLGKKKKKTLCRLPEKYVMWSSHHSGGITTLV